jgi:hypothetical protein
VTNGRRPTTDAGRFKAAPERSPDFAHLSLDGLRSYRRALTAEESRVSYWRRIVQARLDLVRAAEGGTSATVDNLRGVFAEARVDSGPRAGDVAYNRMLGHDLSKAEAQLSAYRTALHKRLAAATGELIARYREQPDLCLSALPTQPPGRSVSHAASA